jgi:hypothetical protein
MSEIEKFINAGSVSCEGHSKPYQAICEVLAHEKADPFIGACWGTGGAAVPITRD